MPTVMNSASWVPALVEHAEGAVPGVHEIGSCSDDPAKGVRQIELGSDGDDRVEETPQLPRTGQPFHPPKRRTAIHVVT